MSIEEYILDKYSVDISDCNSIEEVEDQLAMTTNVELSTIITEYNNYCADEGEMLDTPDYMDELFE